jgi:hypothetical protein
MTLDRYGRLYLEQHGGDPAAVFDGLVEEALTGS